MCDANIVSYFKSTLMPSYEGLDAVSKIKLTSFLAGMISAYKTQLPLTADHSCRDQFNGARNNVIKGKMLAAFNWGQVTINNTYYEAGINLTWQTLYDLVYSPVDRKLQDEASFLVLGLKSNLAIDYDLVVKTINLIHYEFHHDADAKALYSLWHKAGISGVMENLNEVERKQSRAIHLGLALGYYLDLPSSEVNSAATFFDVAHRSQIANFLSAFNELMLIDLDLAIDSAKSTWLTRAKIIDGSLTTVPVLAKLALPSNETVPKAMREEGWLAKLTDVSDLFDKMVTDIKSIQDPENADVRVAMRHAGNVPTNGFALMRNLMD